MAAAEMLRAVLSATFLFGSAACAPGAVAPPAATGGMSEDVLTSGYDDPWSMSDVALPIESNGPLLDAARAQAIAGALLPSVDGSRGLYFEIVSDWGVLTTCGLVRVHGRRCAPEDVALLATATRAGAESASDWHCASGICHAAIPDCAAAYCAFAPERCEEHPPHGGVYGEGSLVLLFEGDESAPIVTAVGFECSGEGDLAAHEVAAPACADPP